MIKWKLETRSISGLKPHPRNPRQLSKHDHEHLSKSLDKFGLIDKPIINPDGCIIGGHQRVRVLQDSGITEVECWVPNKALADKEVDELCIRLNKNTGTFDFDILANQWEVDDLQEYGFLDFEIGLDGCADIDDDEEDAKPKIKILECPECKAHFEAKQAKVIDKGE